MDLLKKAGIIAGAAVGGVIGGTLSVVGKVADVKIIDSIGSSIVDSTIYTGSIAGEIASGTTEVIAGKVTKNPEKVSDGVEDLKSGGGKVVGNFVNNFKLVVDNGGEILEGVKERDGEKIKHGAKTLAKVAAVGIMTVGAIKIDEDNDEESDGIIKNDEDNDEESDGIIKNDEANDEESDGIIKNDEANDEESDGIIKNDEANDEESDGII